MIFFRGGILNANSLAHVVITPLRTLAQRCKRLTPLLAAPAALLLTQGQAKAVLNYNIFESGGNVVVQTSGSLDLTGAGPASPNTSNCGGTSGLIGSPTGVLCTGPGPATPVLAYAIAGPLSFSGSSITLASSASGIPTYLKGYQSRFSIDSNYIQTTPIISSATYNGLTLANLGFTTTGLIGTWTINGTSESIQVFIGPPATSVPGPLSLLGAGAAFGWSRRLRKRIAAPLSTPPQG